MGKVTGFLDYGRKAHGNAPVAERVRHFGEFAHALPEEALRRQGARCMDCGIPYCHEGCPVDNVIPDWNDLAWKGQWRRALHILHSTNNFPEFTGRVCPAPCEAACTLNLIRAPVAIKDIECAIIERGFAEGWVRPWKAEVSNGLRVAVVGSGPAGLACAQQLARAGYGVFVYERAESPGGLLRYGIPDFKLEKGVIDRRLRQMEDEGVVFRTASRVGGDVDPERLCADYDALVLAGGCETPRDLPVPGREGEGIYFAMDYLTRQNRLVAGEMKEGDAPLLNARGLRVVVVGGGDTGSDCIGTANRQGARSVLQLELLPEPPALSETALTWPDWPLELRCSTSHEEGVERHWRVATRGFRLREGRVAALELARLGGEEEVFSIPADMVLLAMGFVAPRREVVEALSLALDERGNVRADTTNYETSRPRVFACGDMRRGQSLVVWAIREGRRCARAVDMALQTTRPPLPH